MGLFAKWRERREMREGFDDIGSPEDKFKFNRDDDVADDQDKTKKELIDIVLSKYPEETMQFLDGIAQRGDEEIKSLVMRLKAEPKPNSFREPMHPTEGDEVVPNIADTGRMDSGE